MEEQEKYAKRLQPRHIVKCPHCGWEYLLGEVYYPENTIGQPSNIIRDPLGKILYEEYEDGNKPLAEDKFVCENCDRPFIVELTTTVKVRAEEPELDFTEKTVQLW